MKLIDRDFIFLDFQTTGTSPVTSDIIEAGWGLYRAQVPPEDASWTIHLVGLESDKTLSRTIQRLTGLEGDYYRLQDSITAAEMADRLGTFLDTHAEKPIVIHFAQFKLPFLWKVLGYEAGSQRQTLADRVICVHKLARGMVPELKSFSLRAVAGYAGYATAEKKRSLDHLLATAHVWRFLESRLEDHEPDADLVVWLRSVKVEAGASLPLHDESLRKKRLALPHRPGVYYFLDRFENILYVGKAADLKNRVNSYFRGKKTKGSRLNEMLTRAADFRFTEVGSELEALLLENDEIKRIDPPYNRMLRIEGRAVRFLTFNDHLPQPRVWGVRNWGPLSSLWMLHSLAPIVLNDLEAAPWPQYLPTATETIVIEGVANLFTSYGWGYSGERPVPDDWHALAQIAWPLELSRLREALSVREAAAANETLEEPADESLAVLEDLTESEVVWTAEDVESFARDAFLHLLRQLYRSRWFLRLCHCRIEWRFAHDLSRLHHFRLDHGQWSATDEGVPLSVLDYRERLAAFDMAVYDRIAIFHAEIRKGLRRGDAVTLYLTERITLGNDDLRRFLL